MGIAHIDLSHWTPMIPPYPAFNMTTSSLGSWARSFSDSAWTERSDVRSSSSDWNVMRDSPPPLVRSGFWERCSASLVSVSFALFSSRVVIMRWRRRDHGWVAMNSSISRQHIENPRPLRKKVRVRSLWLLWSRLACSRRSATRSSSPLGSQS